MKLRILSILLALAMTLGMLPAVAFAESTEPQLQTAYESAVYVNPLYADVLEAPDAEVYFHENEVFYSGAEAIAEEDKVYHTDISEVVPDFRAFLEARGEVFTFSYVIAQENFTQEYLGQLLGDLLNAAYAHTGVPTQGDYIKWHYQRGYIGANGFAYEGVPEVMADITISMEYHTDAAQEAAVTAAVDALLAELNPTGTDYQKIKTVYDWMCANIDYDYDNLNDSQYFLKYTAYAALINRTSVCQGYANLLYRLALEMGIDCRIITGTSTNDKGKPEAHAWNIVKLGDSYYNLDATWDSARTTPVYFLKSESGFENHTRNSDYTTSAFHAAYPMGEENYDPDKDVAVDTLTELEKLIADLPEVSDPMGTEYYFYNQLTDAEKVLYWKISEATWESPEISIDGFEGYTHDERDYSAGRAIAALMADDPEYHMYWLRVFSSSSNDSRYTLSLSRLPTVSEYHVKKAYARMEEIVGIVGCEGDFYSRLRDLLEYMSEVMEYNQDVLVRPSLLQLGYDDSVYGCLLHNVAVCGGFSDTVKLLCDELGIPCIIVHTQDNGAGDIHAWNYVQMENGQWYSVDASADQENRPLMGVDATSMPCLISFPTEYTDFVFPILDTDVYEYDGVYTSHYHTVSNEFAETQPRFLYQVNSDGTTCTIVGFEGLQTGDLIIPETISGYIVTTIGECAFLRCNGFSGSLTIPNTVTKIEDGAFYQCSGFSGNLTLSNNLTAIGQYAFLGCKNLAGNLVLPESLKSVEFGAFIHCKSFDGDLVLPNGIMLGDNVFDYCEGFNGTLHLPDDMEWTDSIVGDTNFKSVSVNQSNSRYTVYDGILYTKDMKKLVWCPTGRVGDVIVPDGVEIIAKCSFDTCRNATGRLILPDGLKAIEEYAFFQAGFSGELIIPATVEKIGQNAFCMTNFVGDLVIPESVDEIGAGAFSAIAFGGELHLPEGLKRIEDNTFNYSSFTGDLVIPDLVTYIGEYAFHGCTFNGELHLPARLEYIGTMAFADAGTDTMIFANSIDLSNSNVEISEAAFDRAVFQGFKCNCGVVQEVLYRNEPTCLDSGLEYIGCPHCGGREKRILEKKEHSIAIDQAIESTCVDYGLTEGSHCSECGVSIKEQEIIPLKDHDFSFNVTLEPTCIEDGIKKAVCNYCNYSQTEVITAPGHDHKPHVTEPDCVNGGYTTYICERCGDSYTADETAALDHEYTYSLTAAPTESATGLITGTCTRCADEVSITLPMLNEDDYIYEMELPPTEETEGIGHYLWKNTDYGMYSFAVKLDKLNTVILGDVNGDGAVGIADLMRLANHFAKGVEIDKACADVNADGKVTIADLMRLANFFAGKAQLG